jgi:hypothetical protein
MGKNIKKIGWQKYEDFLEKQLTSPMLTNIIQNIAMQHLDKLGDIEDVLDEEDDEEDEDDEDYDLFDKKKNLIHSSPMVPITPQLMDDVAMLSSFDCWLGHTNFDLTHGMKDILNKVPGIEVLKIFSRYRFFVGIGEMFDFTEVRNDIEKAILGDKQ